MSSRLGILVLFITFLAGVSHSAFAAGRSDVADAAMKRDASSVRLLIQKRADVNAPQADGATAVHWAVYNDDVELLETLIRAGANVTAVTREGITPLHMACLYGDSRAISALLKAGADAKQKGPAGETMLMLTARNGRPEAIKLLIDAGADVNAKEPLRGTTALMWAVEQKHPAAVAQLLDAKADFAAKSAPAGLPRNYMAQKVNVSNIEAAVRRYAEASANGRTYFEQVEYEEAHGVQHEGRRATGQSAQGTQPAQAAQQEEDDAVIAGLVGTGSGGLTALVLAAREGDPESAKILLDAGADVNQTTDYGWTPLLTATNNRHYALAKFFIERGADVNLGNKGGWTPLYLATDNRNIEGGDFPVPKADLDHLDYISTLLEHGAKPNARVKDNTLTRTIFTMQWFFESGATAFVRASQSGDTELMKLLLKYGADPKSATDHGDNALTAAAGVGGLRASPMSIQPRKTWTLSRCCSTWASIPTGATKTAGLL
jgi:uncharacterized protein